MSLQQYFNSEISLVYLADLQEEEFCRWFSVGNSCCLLPLEPQEKDKEIQEATASRANAKVTMQTKNCSFLKLPFKTTNLQLEKLKLEKKCFTFMLLLLTGAR